MTAKIVKLVKKYKQKIYYKNKFKKLNQFVNFYIKYINLIKNFIFFCFMNSKILFLLNSIFSRYTF